MLLRVLMRTSFLLAVGFLLSGCAQHGILPQNASADFLANDVASPSPRAGSLASVSAEPANFVQTDAEPLQTPAPRKQQNGPLSRMQDLFKAKIAAVAPKRLATGPWAVQSKAHSGRSQSRQVVTTVGRNESPNIEVRRPEVRGPEVRGPALVAGKTGDSSADADAASSLTADALVETPSSATEVQNAYAVQVDKRIPSTTQMAAFFTYQGPSRSPAESAVVDDKSTEEGVIAASSATDSVESPGNDSGGQHTEDTGKNTSSARQVAPALLAVAETAQPVPRKSTEDSDVAARLVLKVSATPPAKPKEAAAADARPSVDTWKSKPTFPPAVSPARYDEVNPLRSESPRRFESPLRTKSTEQTNDSPNP